MPIETILDERPVQCVVCKEKMFYNTHPSYEPEYMIEIIRNYDTIGEAYAHERCMRANFDMAQDFNVEEN